MDMPILELKAPWPLVNVEAEDCELVVSFHPEAFLWPVVEEVGSVLLSLVDETEDAHFILSFGNVDRMTGVGLRKLIRLSEKLQSHGRRLLIKNVCSDLANHLSINGLAAEFSLAA